MKINSVLLDNFRGGSMELPLNGLNVITGQNGVGKTRILQAIQLAVSGNVPHPIEDRNIDLVELFTREIGKQVMSVGLAFGLTRPGFSRIYTIDNKNGSASVSQEILFTDVSETKVKEGEKRIKEMLGEFPVMIDVHEFIRLSDEQRSQLMMEIGAFNIEKWNEPSLREILFSHCYSQELPTKILEAALGKFSVMLKVDVRGGLLGMQEYFKKLESELRKEIKMMSATAQGAVSLNVTNGKTSLRPTATIKEELEAAREQYAKVVAEIAQAKASREQYEKLQKEAVELESKINAVKTLASPDKIVSLKNLLTEKSALIVEVPKEWVDRMAQLTSLVEEANQLHVDARMKENTAKVNIVAMQEKWTLLSQGKCPTCGQECSEVADSITSAIENATIELGELRNDVLAFDARKQNLVTEQQELLDKIAVHRQAVTKAEKEIAQIQSDVSSMQSKLDSISTLENRLKEVREYKHENAYDLDALELQLQGLKNKGELLNAEYTERVQYDAKILQAKEAAAKMKEAEANLEIVKTLREKIRLLRLEIVREALEPIREKASKIFGYALPFGKRIKFDFQFEDARGNEVFKFGWNIENDLGTIFVDFDSLSTAQQLFTLVAVLSPLIELGNPKFKLLMLDNCEVIHVLLREKFLKVLALAKEICWLDNILIASSGEYPQLENQGFNYIRLSEEVPA